MSNKNAHARTLGRELLLNLEEEAKSHTCEHLARHNLLPEERRAALAENLARHLADWLAMAWGGQQVYIPKDNQRRAAMIWEEFDGSNHDELVRKYGLCIQTIYKIIKRESETRRISQASLLDL